MNWKRLVKVELIKEEIGMMIGIAIVIGAIIPLLIIGIKSHETSSLVAIIGLIVFMVSIPFAMARRIAKVFTKYL